MKNKTRGTGALLDTRSKDKRQKDYKFEEIVSQSNLVTWVEKPENEWNKYPIFNQDGSGSCVAQTAAKLLGIMYAERNNGDYVHFSASHIYQRRKNKPNAGMFGINAMDIMRKGTTLEVLAPSQKMTDKEMDTQKITPVEEKVGELFKTANYVVLPNQDIEKIASTIQTTGKGVMVWFYFLRNEWTEKPEIKDANLSLVGGRTVRHSVTAVDYTLHEGEKALIIEDSWGNDHGNKGRRIITEDFFSRRNFFSAYPINFSFENKEEDPDTAKPRYKFKRELEFSSTYQIDPDVAALQDILKYEGYFPKNVDSTGYYGSITAKAVLAFQRAHNVASEAELRSLAGRRVGEKTLATLNKLYK